MFDFPSLVLLRKWLYSYSSAASLPLLAYPRHSAARYPIRYTLDRQHCVPPGPGALSECTDWAEVARHEGTPLSPDLMVSPPPPPAGWAGNGSSSGGNSSDSRGNDGTDVRYSCEVCGIWEGDGTVY